MTSWRYEAILGIVLIALGLAILAANMEVFGLGGAVLGLLLFGGLGLVFAAVYTRSRDNWWAAIPAGALIGLGIVAVLESIESVPGNLSGAVFLWAGTVPFVLLYRREPRFFWASIPAAFLGVLGLLALVSGTRIGGALFALSLYWGAGAAFALLFFRRPSRWWAVIPAGALFSLGLLELLGRSGWGGPSSQGFIFCLGLAATFGFLYVIRNDANRLHWAKYPSIILLAISILFLFSALSWGGLLKIVSIAMVLAGLYLLFMSRRNRSREST